MRSGNPARTNPRSVTLIGENALALDVLSTVAFVLGAEDGPALIRKEGVEAMLVTDQLDAFYTEWLRGNLALL